LFIKGLSINKAKEVFEKLAKVAFKPRKVLHIPFISRIYKLAKSYLADGLYLAENIKAALKAVFGKDKSILDYLYATFISARVSLLVAIIRELLSCIFTNYNGVGTRDED
jgi:ABC-type dipeptide/oligopeptide/nickel transport system permease subunit